MKRYQVSRAVTVGSVTTHRRCGSCDAESPEAAVRKIAHATGLDPRLLTAREVLPLRTPGQKP